MNLGPNTNAPADLLAPTCILCCGEDQPTLLAAMGDAGFAAPDGSEAPSHYAYRCYAFWKWPDLLLAWTGIGTGCLEPLLWEILRPGVIRRIALVGTAGRMPRSQTAVGRAYPIAEAWSVGTGLDIEPPQQPLRPRWPGLTAAGGPPTASSVSTEFFFGFSPEIRTRGYPVAGNRLRAAYDEHERRGTELVEMEVAQFYAFCEAFPGSPDQFIAVKGVSNTLGVEDEQVALSRDAIAESIRVARGMLGVK